MSMKEEDGTEEHDVGCKIVASSHETAHMASHIVMCSFEHVNALTVFSNVMYTLMSKSGFMTTYFVVVYLFLVV